MDESDTDESSTGEDGRSASDPPVAISLVVVGVGVVSMVVVVVGVGVVDSGKTVSGFSWGAKEVLVVGD